MVDKRNHMVFYRKSLYLKLKPCPEIFRDWVSVQRHTKISNGVITSRAEICISIGIWDATYFSRDIKQDDGF